MAKPLTIPQVARVLEQRADHHLNLEEWAEFLALAFPQEYAEPGAAGGPTPCLAGTKGKLAVMQDRIERGLSPFHPLDGLAMWSRINGGLTDGQGFRAEKKGREVRILGVVELQGHLPC